MGKIWLDTFTQDRYNIFDSPKEKLIGDLKKQVDKAYADHDKWYELAKLDPTWFNQLTNQTGHLLYSKMYGYIEDANYLAADSVKFVTDFTRWSASLQFRL